MKIKVIKKPYSEIISELEANPRKHVKPVKPNIFFRTLMKLVSIPDLISTRFHCEKIGMEKLGKNEPAFFLMNHSSFIDLEIAASVLYPRPFNIVATTDGFIGKEWLMRQIGCIPTRKFVADPTLIRDMHYAIKKKRSSVVMFPEAGYSFDGRATTLPDTLGRCVKMMGVPLVMIRTFGAFTRDPLYNNLQRRKVDVSARVEYLLSKEEIAAMPDEQITALIREQFSFDSFRWQEENQISVKEPFRADGLNRILYKCPACLKEGEMEGKGIHIKCNSCGKSHTLTEYGTLTSEGEAAFKHVTDWCDWERECVREEIESGRYTLDIPVDLLVIVDTKTLYSVGEGRLRQTKDGFHLVSDDGQINYEQKVLTSYTLNSDFNWYELGDIISIGDNKVLFYCIPKTKGDVAAKARLAQEEAYKLASLARSRA